MAKPNSRSTLISYCKRALGHPVIEINVDDDQVDDRIDEAFQFYNTYHSDAVERVFLKHLVTASYLTLSASVAENFTLGETITGGTSGATAVVITGSTGVKLYYPYITNTITAFTVGETITGGSSATTAVISTITLGDIEKGYLDIPDLVTNVTRVFPIMDTETNASLFDIKYQLHLNDIYSLGFLGSLVNYEISQQWLSMVDLIIDSDDHHYDFNRHRNTIRIDMDWEKEAIAGQTYIILDCQRILDPTTYTDIYDDYFLKQYATQLIKKQWGANLIKFEGMVMPGGVTFNGRQLFDDANEALIQLEEQARLNWEDPIDFMVG
jgi:hypothetical protein